MGLDAEHRLVVTSSARIAIIGAGPAGLIAAETLAAASHPVTVYDRMPSPARKFLMAGRGGLNLTHSEALSDFLTRYGATRPMVEAAITAYPPNSLVGWAETLGQETFVGSSGRIFPRRLKASPLLRAWLARLAELGVEIKANHLWRGWNDTGELVFTHQRTHETSTDRPHATLLALGGASWPKLGSDGDWTNSLQARGVAVSPFEPSNCGVRIAWSERFLDKAEGCPLKRMALSVANQTRQGEAVVTRAGLEGGVIYALSSNLRKHLADGPATVHIDLRPDRTLADLESRLSAPRAGQSTANVLRKRLNLDPQSIALLYEACHGRLPADALGLATLIKAVPVPVEAMADITRAISTAGGIARQALDDHFMLKDIPGTFAAGEMLDWDAPTGGYLLQATFATGIAAAQGIRKFLHTHGSS